MLVPCLATRSALSNLLDPTLQTPAGGQTLSFIAGGGKKYRLEGGADASHVESGSGRADGNLWNMRAGVAQKTSKEETFGLVFFF